MSDCIYLSLHQIRQQLLEKNIHVEEVIQICCSYNTNTEKKLHSFITLCTEQALEQAKNLDKTGPDPQKPLWGIPIAIKDNILTKDICTTAASNMLKTFIPTYDAHAVELLKKAGAIIIGKTNMDEFAMGSSTENSAFGPSYNPWNTMYIPGGSSGGSASSVSAYQCFAALGTDTGGSIRQPAALSGCIGLKPTYGRVSRRGVISYASSLDQVGPMTRTIEDAALLLSVLTQHDPLDTTSSQHQPPIQIDAIHKKHLKNIILGIPQSFITTDVHPDIAQAYEQTIQQAKELGAKLINISLPHALHHAVAAYYTIATAEASSNLARFDGIRYGYRSLDSNTLDTLYFKSRSEGFGKEVQQRILLGTHVLSSKNYENYYIKAAQLRRLIQQNFEAAFEQCHAILTPTSPVPAWPIGSTAHDPIIRYLKDIYTVSINLAGLPALTIPVGFTNNLPIGIQIIGKAFDETTILSIGHALHSQLDLLTKPKL